VQVRALTSAAVRQVEQDMCVRYLDRFLMYYILTADKLQRTAPWLEKMEGGIEHLRDVVILDTLGICDELERRMGELVGSYECEWKAVVNDPERVKHFKQFVNTSETEKGIAWKEPAEGRPGPIPVDWPPITKNPVS
jgi:NAD(P)H-nitrite reductase large subunit